MNKEQLIENVRGMLRAAHDARKNRCDELQLARAHARLDGYMRALQDAGICSSDELLAVIEEQRRIG